MKYWILGILFILSDQISKFSVRAKMIPGQSVSVIGDFFHITYVKNTGAAFNSFDGARYFLIILPIILMLFCALYIYRHRDEHWLFYLSATMVIAGGTGNLIDRVFFGFVTDMFDFSIFQPVFNVADIFITAGCIMLAIAVLAEDKLKKTNGKNRKI